MKRLAALLIALSALGAWGQNPPPMLLYDVSGNPYPTGGGTPLPFNPPPFTCYTIVSGATVPCTFSGGGGGTTTNPLTMNDGGSGAASGATFNGSAPVTLSYNTLGAAAIAAANTFSAPQTISGNAAASVSPLLLSGTAFSGGNGTTTLPYMLLQPSTATPETGWSTNGTMLGINAGVGFGGLIVDLHVNNGGSAFSVNSIGSAQFGSSANFGAALSVSTAAATAIRLASNSVQSWSTTTNFNGTPDLTECRQSPGILQIGASTGCGNTGSVSALGIVGGSFQQQAASNTGGTCAMAAGTSCTITIGHTYTTPVCIATLQSATLTGAATGFGCTVAGTTVTITAGAANSSTWGAFVFGNPN